MAHFLVATFNYGDDTDGFSKIQGVVEGALDWYRWNANTWILWTNRTPDEWQVLVSKHMSENTTFFFCALDVGNRQGWSQTEFWDWLNKSR
jgi:hypothetical protein